MTVNGKVRFLASQSSQSRACVRAPASVGGTDPFALGGDLDVYRFYAVAGQQLNFNVNPPFAASDPTGVENAVLTLFDSAGNVLATNDNTNLPIRPSDSGEHLSGVS